MGYLRRVFFSHKQGSYLIQKMEERKRAHQQVVSRNVRVNNASLRVMGTLNETLDRVKDNARHLH